MTQKKKGFTLIELMVVMAIIAVLAVLMVGAIQLARNTATETTHRSNTKTIQTALEGGFAKYKQYCGATGQIPCAAIDLTAASAAAYLDVTLGSSSCTGNQAGGGRITTLTSTTYVIYPSNYTCTAYTNVSDAIYSGLAKPTTLPTY